MMMRLSRYTPPHTTAARHRMRAPVVVVTAVTRPCSASMPQISACRRARFSASSSARRIRR